LPLDAAGQTADLPEDPNRPAAEQFLVCAIERDLPTLLPLLRDLPQRDGNQPARAPAMPQAVTDR
jgi:hypothetical protein